MARKRRRKLKISSLLFLIVFFSIIALFIYLYIDSKHSLEKTVEVNINDEIYNTDCVGKDEYTIVSEKEQIDTSSIKEIEKIIEVKNKMSLTKEITCIFKVIDKENPKITYKETLTTEEGIEINLLDGVSASDNSKEEIKVEVIGEYNINKIGSYELYYTAKDSSGNEAKEKFTLLVNQKTPVVDYNSDTTPTDYFTTSKGFTGYKLNGITYIDGILIANKTYSLPSDYYPGDLTSETRSAMNEMFSDASARGLNIYLSSGFRSYDTQDIIYNRYVRQDGQEEADTYSARPGYSEHQSGYAFDVNEIDYTFDDTPEAAWLSENCYKYGFILRYPKGKTNETGYVYESWHFRYVGVDLATKLYNNGDWLTIEDYFGITSKYE